MGVSVAVRLGLGVTLGVELGVEVTLGVAVGVGVAVAVGVAVGVGVGGPPGVARYRTRANSTPPTATILPSGCNTASFAAEFKSPSEVRTFPPTPKIGSSEPSGLHRAKRKPESSNSVFG